MYLIRHCEDSDVTFISSQNSNRTNTTFEKYKQELICAGLFFSLVLKPLPNKVNIILSEKILGYENPVLADWLADKAEGNPYIITEYIRFAISYLASSSASPKTVDDLLRCEDIPQNVTRYLNYVFAPLSHAASTLLSTAAVYGTEFDYQTVFRATDLRYENALDALDELIASGIVFHTNGNLYRFHHKTLAKVAYERIQESRRKYIHKRLSESLESTAVSRTEQEQALLIYNYIKSDQFGKASELAMQVGNASLSSGIYDLAISNYKIVCNFDPLAGYLHIMDTLYLLGDDSENAKQQFSKEFRMAQQVTGEALQSYTEIHHFLLSSFPLQPDFPYASQINVPDSINALCRLSYSNFDMGDMYCDSPCLALDIRTLLDVSIIFAQSGSLDDAESILSALTSAPFKNDGENSPYLLVVAKLVLGCLLLKKDDSLAKDVLLSGMHTATNIGFDVLLPLFRYNYGKYLQRNGNYDQSRTMILSACSLSEKLGRSDWTAAIKAARDSVTKHPQSPIS